METCSIRYAAFLIRISNRAMTALLDEGNGYGGDFIG